MTTDQNLEKLRSDFSIDFDADFDDLLRQAKFDWNVDDDDYQKVFDASWFADSENWKEAHEQKYWEEAQGKYSLDELKANEPQIAHEAAQQALHAYADTFDLEYFRHQLATFELKFSNTQFAHAVRALVTPLLNSDDAIRKSEFFQSGMGGVYSYAFTDVADDIEANGFRSQYYLKDGSVDEVAQIWVDDNQDAILEAWEDAKEKEAPLNKEEFAEAMEQHIAKTFMQNITANSQNTVTVRENGFDHRAEAHQLVTANIDRWYDQLQDLYRGKEIPQVYGDEVLDRFYSQSEFEADDEVVDRMADAIEAAQLRNGSNRDALEQFEQGFASGTLQLLLTELEDNGLAISDFVADKGQTAEQVVAAYVADRGPDMFQAGSTFNGIEEVSADPQRYGAETAKMYFGDFRTAVGLEEMFVNAKQQQIEFSEDEFADGVQEAIANEVVFSDEDLATFQDFFKQELGAKVRSAYTDAKSALAEGDLVSWMHPDNLSWTVTNWTDDHWDSIGDQWADFKQRGEV